jgi:hypothetical protein
MAVRTESFTLHSYLCAQDCDEADLVRLYGPLQRGKRAQSDQFPDTRVEAARQARSPSTAREPGVP